MRQKRQRTINEGPIIENDNVQTEETRGNMVVFLTVMTGRDTFNEAAKVAPGVIKAAADDINKIAEQRINQIISKGGV